MRNLNNFELVAVSGGFFGDPFADESFSGGGSSYGGNTSSYMANTNGGGGWGGGMCSASPYEVFNVGGLSYPTPTTNANNDSISQWGLNSPIGYVMDAFAIGVGVGTMIYNWATDR